MSPIGFCRHTLNQGGESMSCNMSPHLISKFEQIIDHDMQVIRLLADIADDIDDPTLLAMITNIIGDEIGHVRFLTLLLSPVTTIP